MVDDPDEDSLRLRKRRRLEMDIELQMVDPQNEPYKKLIKKMLTDVLNAKNVTEDSYFVATSVEGEDCMKSTRLAARLEEALNLLENAYKLGLVTLKENVSLALLLAGEDQELKEEFPGESEEINEIDNIVMDEIKLDEPTVPIEEEKFSSVLLDRGKENSVPKKKAGKRFQCDYCEYSVPQRFRLINHMKSKHREQLARFPFIQAEKGGNPELEANLKQMGGGFKYACDQCDYKTDIARYLADHTRLKHEEKRFLCDECDYSTNQPSNLKRHYSRKNRVTDFKCRLCPAPESSNVFTTFVQYRQHVIKDHKGNNYSCNACDFETENFQAFIDHKQVKHNVPSTKREIEEDKTLGTGEDSIKDDPLQDESPAGGGDGDVPVPVPVPAEAGIQCSLCTYAAPDRLDLVEHIKVEHDIDVLENQDPDNPDAVLPPLKKSLKKKDEKDDFQEYFCNYCNFAGIGSACVKLHLRKEHNTVLWIDHLLTKEDLTSTFVCALCNFKAKNMLSLVKHKEKVHEMSNEYPCMLCDFVGKKFSYLKQHVEAHHEEGKYHCDQCTYVASTKARLKVHIESKHEMKRYPCEDCGFMSTCPYYLQRHREKHLKIRYKCDECDETKASQEVLRRHKKIMHQGLKFYCDQCDYSVGSRARFLEHKRTKHEGKIYRCDECDYVGNSAAYLKTHKEVKHLGLRYPCEVCGQVFMRKNTRRNHERKVHKLELKIP